MRAIRCLVLLTLSVLASGCAYKLPAGYVKVAEPYGYRFRAVSAEGAAFTLRSEENPENGDLTFWEKAIMSRLVGIRGYKLANRLETKLPGAASAIELTFDYNRDGVDYTYLVTLCVQGRRVHVFEAAGTRAQMTTDLPEIRKSIEQWPAL